MAVIFWIVAVAFVVMFGWSQLWDTLAGIIGKSRPAAETDFLADTAFVARGTAQPAVFYELEVAREAATLQSRGQYIGEKERDILYERVFLSMILDEVLFKKALTAGFSVSKDYLGVISDTLTYYNRFFAQQRMISEKDFFSIIEKRETSKQLKALIGMSAWISPVQAVVRMRMQTDKYTTEYAFFTIEENNSGFSVEDSVMLSVYDSLRYKGYTSLPEQAVVRYLGFSYGPQEEDWIRTERRASQLIERMSGLEGDSLIEMFSNIASQYSDDYSTKTTGGYLGWINPNAEIDENFIQSSFALEPGEIGGPVRTVWGWHIIYSEAKTEDSVEVSHILLGVKGDAERDQKSLELMTRIRQDSKFMSLDSIASLYSLEIKETSPFDRWGKYPPEFGFIQSAVNFAFSADSGTVGGPYIGSSDIVIIQTLKRIPGSEITFEDMKNWISDSLAKEAALEVSFQKALRCARLIEGGQSLASAVAVSGGIYSRPSVHGFFESIENSGSGGTVQMVGLSASEPGIYGPIKGTEGCYIVHLIQKESLSDSIVQTDLPAYWFNLSLMRGREFVSQWSACILEKAFSSGEIRDLRYRLKQPGE
ncbi:peptidylprolyl isomerase [candidate division WOR-3 bacterium]|nr:peptidylprolyl isomerase [candidate division WOR-3 bacterium]